MKWRRRGTDQLSPSDAQDVLDRSEAARIETEQMIAEVKQLIVELHVFSEDLRTRAKAADDAKQ